MKQPENNHTTPPETPQEGETVTLSRRRLLEIIAATGGAVTVSTVLPGQWVTPIVQIGYLPVHALVSPTPTPTNTPVPPSNPLAPQPGRSRVYLQNKYTDEYTIDVSGQVVKVLPDTVGFDVFIDVDPGKLTYSMSVPSVGGITGEFEIGPDQSWVIILDESLGVRGRQIYP